MSSLQFAAQMYTVREFTRDRAGLEASLCKMADAGYPAVQLSAVGAMNGEQPEVDAATARAMLDANGMRCIATHRPLDRLMDHAQDEIEEHKTLACDYVAIGGIPGEQSVDAYRAFLRDSSDMIATLKEGGIRFGVHNHAKEFYRPDPSGPSLMDVLIDEGGEDLFLELDLYWIQHAGVNPVRVLERCHGRVPVIHIKDKAVDREDGPVMVPIGMGNLDWEHILPACREAGVQWVAVEQDVCRWDAFDCLASSLDFLKSRDW